MPMPQLFLDCDGVLADFDTAAERLFGLPPRQHEDQHGSKRFWCDLQSAPEFFRNLPLMLNARKLYEAVKHYQPEILTSCPRGGWAESQKLTWAADHFPGVPMITVCGGENKRNHMQPGDVLVDDWPKHQQLWEDAGGVFILYRDREVDQAIEQIHQAMKAE